MREHTYETHEKCDRNHCAICDGGLSFCTVCHLAEGALTTECPGAHVNWETIDEIYAGRLDFKDGQWRATATEPMFKLPLNLDMPCGWAIPIGGWCGGCLRVHTS